jgi:uncharacterized damage-inducible protein DinB
MTAPMDPTQRPEPPYRGDEPATLTGFLDYQRATLEWKCSGLDPEQLARRAVPTTTLSLLGLVRHMAEVERAWFDWVATGERRPYLYCTDADPDGDFDGAIADPAVVDDAFAAWRTAIEEARAVVSRTALEHTFVHRADGPISLRWVLCHMIEEYARHNGHADLLREAIDGATGE